MATTQLPPQKCVFFIVNDGRPVHGTGYGFARFWPSRPTKIRDTHHVIFLQAITTMKKQAPQN
jgi:hypothetical protein